MAKNKTFTGGRKSAGTPTLNKNSYNQLIRIIRKEKAVMRQHDGKTAE